jgi:hypothetical protein
MCGWHEVAYLRSEQSLSCVACTFLHVLEIPQVSLFHMRLRLQDLGQDLVSNMDRLEVWAFVRCCRLALCTVAVCDIG